jgi:hypothetical protein
MKKYLEYIPELVTITKFSIPVSNFTLLSKSLITPEKYFTFTHNGNFNQPEFLISRLSNYFGIKTKEFKEFKLLENEIVHFKRISITSSDKLYEIIPNIKKVKTNDEKKRKVLEQLKLDFKEHKDLDKYTYQVQQVEKNYKMENEFSLEDKKIKIKYVHNHYYIPIVLSEDEKLNYLTHIIKVPSEVRFLSKLEKYLEDEDNLFKQFDWWMFSKLDETIDKIFIPYYDFDKNSMAEYKPDFIFWLKKGNNYKIIFVDPKGTAFARYQHKIEGFKKIFYGKEFTYDNLVINVYLKLFTSDTAQVAKGYREFWFDNINELIK